MAAEVEYVVIYIVTSYLYSSVCVNIFADLALQRKADHVLIVSVSAGL